MSAVRTDLEENFPTFHLVGLNGTNKYNNRDHAMIAMLTVKTSLPDDAP